MAEKLHLKSRLLKDFIWPDIAMAMRKDGLMSLNEKLEMANAEVQTGSEIRNAFASDAYVPPMMFEISPIFLILKI